MNLIRLMKDVREIINLVNQAVGHQAVGHQAAIKDIKKCNWQIQITIIARVL